TDRSTERHTSQSFRESGHRSKRYLIILTVFPIVMSSFPLVRHSAGVSVAETGRGVGSSVEVSDAVGVGLLEERERAARQRVEVLQVEVQEAEAAWERFVIARQTVAEVPAELPVGEEAPSAGVAGERGARVAGAVPGSVVPAWREDLDPGALAPDYQRLVEVLAENGEVMDCRQLAAKVEGVRSKVKRLAARGWLAEGRPGMFRVPAGRAGGS
ncbi:hypothetical protein ACFYMW_38665, partial [Streptomyces sp. NPDC006692]|uniref:hypothetical protein n=1 Tax=Streptomyces sp. NPDC006692 TaxID=3364758 RepID=UPI0036876184